MCVRSKFTYKYHVVGGYPRFVRMHRRDVRTFSSDEILRTHIECV